METTDQHAPAESTHRDPSTYEAMIRCELAAGAPFKAIELYNLAQERSLPPTTSTRLQELLVAAGIELLPLDGGV